MPETADHLLHIIINGRVIRVSGPITVAAAIAIAGVPATRRSPSGDIRGALCGMGICYECRAHIDGVAHQRTCMVACRDGMRVDTDA